MPLLILHCRSLEPAMASTSHSRSVRQPTAICPRPFSRRCAVVSRKRQEHLGLSILEILISTIVIGVGMAAVGTLNAVALRGITTFDQENDKEQSVTYFSNTSTGPMIIDSVGCTLFTATNEPTSSSFTCDSMVDGLWNTESGGSPVLIVHTPPMTPGDLSTRATQNNYVYPGLGYILERACYGLPLPGVSQAQRDSSNWNQGSGEQILTYPVIGKLNVQSSYPLYALMNFKGGHEPGNPGVLGTVESPQGPPVGHRLFATVRVPDGDGNSENDDIKSWYTAAPMVSTFCP